MSPQSAFVNRLAYERREYERDSGKRKITDADEATRYLMSLATKKAG